MYNKEKQKFIYPVKDKPFFTKWVEELRSGKYIQGENYLVTIEEGNSPTFCCIGVACVMNNDFEEEVLNYVATPYEIDIEGINTNLYPNDWFEDLKDSGLLNLLANMNDGINSFYLETLARFSDIKLEERNYSFDEIADFLEKYVDYEK